MALFHRIFTSILLAITCASSTFAVPRPESSKFSTHRVRNIGRGLHVEAFHPSSTYQTFGEGIDHPLSKRADLSIEDSAISFAASHLQLDTASVSYKSGFSGEAAKHAFLRQSHNGIPFANAVANVAFSHDNKVVAFGSSFVKPTSISSPTPSVEISEAITAAEGLLDGTYNQHPASLEYFVKSDGSVALTHVVQIRNEAAGTWFEAFVDAHSGELLSVTDFVTKASYRVIPIQKQAVPDGFEVLTNPQDLSASPNGWHNTGTGGNTTNTSGNNVIAWYANTETNLTTQSSSGLNFVYVFDPTKSPTSGDNPKVAQVNAFYLVNSIHDIAYKYGFTEAAFNFQVNNFGKGGVGNDRVFLSVQNPDGHDNADFTTPPDGQFGYMRMFLWDYTSPQRDGVLQNDIVVHESTHGITNRMTGGGTGRCLQTTEAGGLGEGWSDAMADWTEHASSATPDFVVGSYVTNSSAGIRSHPYSTSTTVNPLRYSTVGTLPEVHTIGEVWANILHNVYAVLVAAHGWSATARTDPSGTEGNIVFLHLFIDALPLQPCNPTFTAARDAWIQADVNRYGGANKCTLWQVFASRGLGVGAANFVDSTAVPAGC